MAYQLPGYGYSVPRINPGRDTLGTNSLQGSTSTNKLNPYWKKEKSNLDQMLHNRLCAEATDIKGATAMYYVMSLDKGHPTLQEKPVRTILRTFEIPVTGESMMQGDNYLYSKHMIMGTDEFPIFIHRTQFFEHNMINMLEYGEQPTSASNLHNIWDTQSGVYFGIDGSNVSGIHNQFFYKGYIKSQIYPKAGDLIKLKFEDSLYEIMDVSDKVSEDQFAQAKYWFKIYLKAFRDNASDVANNVVNDTKDLGYVDDKFNNHMDAILSVNRGVRETKDEVLYRPDIISPSAVGITDQPRAQGPEIFGGW